MIDIAYAMAPGGQGGGEMNSLVTLAMMASLFGVFYLLLIRPQQKRAREHKEMLDNLKKGDSVITQGGIYGKIASISDKDQTVILEVAEKVRLKVARGYIAGPAPSQSEQNS